MFSRVHYTLRNGQTRLTEAFDSEEAGRMAQALRQAQDVVAVEIVPAEPPSQACCEEDNRCFLGPQDAA